MRASLAGTARASRWLGPLALVAGVAACEPPAAGGGAASPAGGTGSGAPELPESEPHDLVGVQAPDFSLPAQFGGESVSLAEVRGKVAIVDFWATWCDPCKESFPFYQDLLDRHASDLVIVGVSEDDEPDGIPAFGEETQVSFPLVWDEDKSLARRYDPQAMPTTFVVDREGIVRFVHGGFRAGDERLLEQAVAALVAE